MAIKQKPKQQKPAPAAKAKSPPPPPPAAQRQQVAVREKEHLPTAAGPISEEEFLGDAKKGTSATTSQDLAIPFVMILQKLSPQCDRSKPEYMEDAEEGMIIEKASAELWSGEDGVLIVPCYYERRYTEWRPRSAGGGLVRDHGSDPSMLTQCQKNDRGKDITPDGNEFVASGMHYILLVDPDTGAFRPAVISMSATQLKHSRRWNTAIVNLRIPHPTQKGETFQPACFYMTYRATTKPESNAQGSWFGWSIAPYKPTVELPNGPNIYRAAKAFCQSVEKGEVRAAVPADIGDAGDGGAAKAGEDIPF